MATHRVLYQKWELKDSWSGPSSADGSLHLSDEDRLAYIKARRGPLESRTPETYEVPSATPTWVEVDEAMYAKVAAGRPGLRVKTSIRFQAVSR